MFIENLFEGDARRVLVIYPGRFQPFHKGHRSVVDYLNKKFGAANVYIATSDKVDPPRSPFNFKEKLEMMKLTGIDPSRVVQTRSPYRANEIVDKYDPNTTVLFFAVSEKDMAEDPRFSFKPKKDGSPAYMQKAPDNLSKAETLDKHAYIMAVPTLNFKVMGKPMKSATEVRSMFASMDDQQKKQLINDLFGGYSDVVFNLMSEKITESFTPSDAIHPANVMHSMMKKRRGDRSIVRGGVNGIFDRAIISINNTLDQLQNVQPGSKADPTIYNRLKLSMARLQHQIEASELDEGMIKFDRNDPQNSDFAPPEGMGSMSLRGWKKNAIQAIQQAADKVKYFKDGGDGFDWGQIQHLIGPRSALQAKIREIISGTEELQAMRKKGGRNSRNIKAESRKLRESKLLHREMKLIEAMDIPGIEILKLLKGKAVKTIIQRISGEGYASCTELGDHYDCQIEPGRNPEAIRDRYLQQGWDVAPEMQEAIEPTVEEEDVFVDTEIDNAPDEQDEEETIEQRLHKKWGFQQKKLKY